MLSSERPKSASFVHRLRAPLFHHAHSTHVDKHANQKYCSPAVMAKIFTEADLDGNGTISFEEFARSNLAAQLSPAEARTLFVRVDTDKSGEIDANEFLDACRVGLLKFS